MKHLDVVVANVRWFPFDAGSDVPRVDVDVELEGYVALVRDLPNIPSSNFWTESPDPSLPASLRGRYCSA